MVLSQAKAPTEITAGPDELLATVHRGDTSAVLGPGGAELLRVLPDPADAGPDVIRSLLVTPDGPLGQLDLIRRTGGWSLSSTLDAISAIDVEWWVDHPATSLPIPFLGTRLWLTEPVGGVLADALLGVCVDLAIGLRPYTSAMT